VRGFRCRGPWSLSMPKEALAVGSVLCGLWETHCRSRRNKRASDDVWASASRTHVPSTQSSQQRHDAGILPCMTSTMKLIASAKDEKSPVTGASLFVRMRIELCPRCRICRHRVFN